MGTVEGTGKIEDAAGFRPISVKAKLKATAPNITTNITIASNCLLCGTIAPSTLPLSSFYASQVLNTIL